MSGLDGAVHDGQQVGPHRVEVDRVPEPGGEGGDGAISSSALAAFKSCLSQNGVKVTGTTATAVLGELRNSAGKTAAAVRTCRVLLQPAAPTPSPST